MIREAEDRSANTRRKERFIEPFDALLREKSFFLPGKIDTNYPRA